MNRPIFISGFPLDEKGPLYWWYFDEAGLAANGCDTDPLLVAGLKVPSADTRNIQYATLLPASVSVVRWHPAIEEVTEKQAQAAAILTARKESIRGEDMHVAAALLTSGMVATAAVGRDIMERGLETLANLGIDPDVIVPAGWLIPPSDTEIIEADFGFESLLRGPEFITPNEPVMRDQLAGAIPVSKMDHDALLFALAQIADDASLNLRSGFFVKKAKSSITRSEKKSLAMLLAALVIISLAIPLARWAQFVWATSNSDSAALSAAQTALGPVSDVGTANKMLDERLVAENLGDHGFSVPVSALFSAVQQSAGVSIERLSYDSSGITSATLTAVRNEDINPVLIAVQNAGFAITATPRTDATGTAKADITVRIP